MRFDFTGLGDSEGGFSETNFTTNINDIISASNYLHDNYQEPKLIIGHSLGGTAAVAAVTQLNNVKAVATIASPNKPSHVLGHFEEVKNVLKEKPETSVNILDREFIIKKQLLEDIESYDQVEIIEKLNKPILIMHSPSDKTVSIEEASNLFMGAKHPKSFISLDDIDHLISDKAYAEYIAKNIFSWSDKYLS